MKRIPSHPTLRPLPLILTGLFLAAGGGVRAETLIAGAADAASASASAATASAASTSAPMTTVEVSAAHLRNERIELSPKIGTTVYSLDRHMIEALGQGADTPFNEMLLRLPGVDQDSKASGGLHVRDDHANVQYRINGVQLPESITGFGQSIDTRLVDQVDFMTGALPAQFGLRTAGIVDIQTKEGGKPGGRVGVLIGSHGHVEPGAEVFGSQGAFNYYLSGSYLQNDLGIENSQPTSRALHDGTHQGKTFGNLSYFVDDNTRLGLMFGSYNGRFQIPNNPNQAPAFSLTGQSDAAAGSSLLPSSRLDQQQREQNRFAVVSLQKSLGALSYQVSAFHQYSELHYLPDPLGDLIYNGVASDTLRSNSASGLQLDMGYKLHAEHTLRGGLAYTRQRTRSDNTVRVFATDDAGAQVGSEPLSIVDNSSRTGKLYSLYLQDEWRIGAPLTLNYGLRFDKVDAYTNEQQWSPRINLAYQLDKDTALHAGYSRYFTPPPQELAAQGSINLYANTTNAPSIAVSDNVKAERSHYYDIGLSHQLSARLTLSADAYYKKIRNLLDEGQFGQALILSPFNYATGYAKGLELSAVYSEKQWGGYLNLATQKAQGRNIVSGQALIDADELAYIRDHDVYLDHDQTFTASAGLHYHFGTTQINADMLYGSGLRMTPQGGAPNSASLPSHTTFNLGWTQGWKNTLFGNIDGRLALMNVFDRSYLLRDGSGVGVGAPQYGARRTIYAGISSNF
ncbi:TonB-dependent receptor [Rugamonas sp. CCM 8940]|uniref:TonB-dependent receptor n=1 Tax=Rugamonas sp. CCM 8940 TaxID=2765359 RepID=UPI0018F6C6F2|nr:TonB-dependent receptor [Rugamonas sp. CCM 8940]MBJ7312276.1 TonB-dependent receptor [Rugamonas sp. CCM 8940]